MFLTLIVIYCKDVNIFASMMIFLKKLNIANFKNLKSVELSFKNKYICFAGNNGVGKTNLLDSIYYLSIGKSYFNSIDKQNILHEENYFNLKGNYSRKDENVEIFCAFTNRKKITINGNNLEKLSDIVGEIPIVIVTPYDNTLITGGSEERRRFLDMIISQLDKNYLTKLVEYNRTLKQRNAQLKILFENRSKDTSLIEVYDTKLIETGNFIFEKRKSFLENFTAKFYKYYSNISEDKENVQIAYASQLKDNDFEEILKSGFEKDFITQRSNYGIHKDDLELSIFDYPAKKFASQGQQKSFLLALKLAQFDISKGYSKFVG